MRILVRLLTATLLLVVAAFAVERIQPGVGVRDREVRAFDGGNGRPPTPAPGPAPSSSR
jgi:hypothetical protein